MTEFSIHGQVLVQVGDILDRGEDEIAILSLLKSLDIQAKANGGAVFQVCTIDATYMRVLISIVMASCLYNEHVQLHQPCYPTITFSSPFRHFKCSNQDKHDDLFYQIQ